MVKMKYSCASGTYQAPGLSQDSVLRLLATSGVPAFAPDTAKYSLLGVEFRVYAMSGGFFHLSSLCVSVMPTTFFACSGDFCQIRLGRAGEFDP